MCGIIGTIKSDEGTTARVLGMLQRLEYRGYDSAGVATEAGGSLQLRRAAGKLDALRARLEDDIPGEAGIGHTRWATHGAVTEENAHPHLGCGHGGRHFAIAHNGIIENHHELRAGLQARGHRLTSETDSEVIVHLLEEAHEAHPEATLGELLRAIKPRLVGEYAVVAIGSDFPGRVAGLTHRSPLVAGVGNGAKGHRVGVLASDASAFADLTQEVIYLSDGQVIELSPDGHRLWDTTGAEVSSPAVVHVDAAADTVELGEYAHFMEKEIHEQPAVLRRTLESLADGDRIRLPHLDLDPEALARVQRVDLVACGTAWHAAKVTALAIEHHARIPARAVLASEYKYAHPVVDEHSLVVAISQSGETADTRDAAEMAKEAGARLVAITNTNQSQIHRLSDGAILTRAGTEIGVASTKCYTAQLLAGTLLALRLANLRGHVDDGRLAELLGEARELPGRVEHALHLADAARGLAERYHQAHSALFIGRLYNFATALEGALKLKEISYIHAEGYGAGEMKHGPVALVSPDYPVFAVALSNSSVYDKMLSNIEVVRAREGPVIAVATEGDERLPALAETLLEIPETAEVFSPIVAVVPLQLLAYSCALLRGCDPDRPRNLAKSVTVE